MPVFEYQCQQCGRDFEHFTLSTRAEPGACPACGAADVRRKFSSFASKGHSRGPATRSVSSSSSSSCGSG